MKKYQKEELLILWLDSFNKISYEHKKQLFYLLKDKTDYKSFIENNEEVIKRFVGDEYDVFWASATKEYFNDLLTLIDENGVTVLTFVSSEYPKALLMTEEFPLCLYCTGNVELLSGENFGVVGSRKSLPIQIKICQSYVKALSDSDFNLITGIAEGIDKTVIETAIENNGKVISVLAGGLKNIYPKSHENLVSKIIENGGLVISEYQPNVPVMPYNFPVRNRIIAGLSKGVLIVSGAKKSGTLYTAEYAEEYGRDLFAVPYNIGVVSGEGTNDLIKRGAYLTDSPKDILEFYGKDVEKKKEIELSDIERDIIKILGDGAIHIEKICEKLGKKVFELSPIISMLEIKGIICRAGINVYALAKNISEE